MERDEFISKLSTGMLAACIGCSLVGCSSKNNPGPADATAPNPPAKGSGSVFTTDLSSSLTAIGDSETMNGIILVRIATANTANSFTAVQVQYTHQGGT